MNSKKILSELYNTLRYSVRWTLLTVPVAIVIGTAVAFFLWSLQLVTHSRFNHNWLLFLLPLGGILIHLIYRSVGRSSEKGNNLIIEEIHEPGAGVPMQMPPIILITTLITHLFGGSAGREGTAVQIGGGIAAMFGTWFKLDAPETKMILTAGVAAGFGAVFGTPLTGAIFAIEVLVVGRLKYEALLPALIASVVGDFTVSAWGIHHTSYHINEVVSVDLFLLGKVIVASAIFGLASFIFSFSVNQTKTFFLKHCKIQWLIPVFGGLILILLTYTFGKADYLSLGVDAAYPGAVTIPSAFQTGGSDTWSWLWKTVYTAVTLGTGFKGGEVTPLFYIGATLGNTLSVLLDAPVSLFAALGFIAVFAGATNTPLACTLMGAELFGNQYILLFAIACFTAYYCSGTSGIYTAQRIRLHKIHHRD